MDNYGYQPENTNGRPFAIARYPSRNGPDDYLVEVNSRSKFFRRPIFFKRLSAILFLLAILFLIGLIIITYLYLKTKTKIICTSDQCLRTATNLKFSLDLSVDPCENFYDYTCGKWSEEHPNHGWWSTFSSFTTITERVAIDSLNALTSRIHGAGEPESLQKSRDFYKSCMDVDTLDDLGISSMFEYLRRARLPIVPSYFTKSQTQQANFTFDWMKTEALMKQIFMMDVFIGAVVDNNIFNGSQNVIYLGVIYQTSPLPSPIKRKKFSRPEHILGNENGATAGDNPYALSKVVTSNIIKYVLREIMANRTDKTHTDDELQEAADIILFTTDIVKELISNHTDPNADEDDLYTITFKNLQAQTDAILTPPQPNLWRKYFRYLFTGTNVTVDFDKDLLYVTDVDLEFVKKILQFILVTPDINIELYMWWSAVYAMIINTSSDIADFINKQLSFLGKSTGNIARSRSLECALLINNYMGYAVSYVLADKTFSNRTKLKVEQMINELKEGFVGHVNAITWMDQDTKKVTLEKSKEMLSFIGYPDWLFQKGKLDEYYEDVEINNDTYLDNMISTIMAHNLKKMRSLREIHKRDWYSEPIEVNAFNSFSDNAINIPMAILSFPMYNLGLEVLNYGSIGAILGHEFTHGFDNMGRKHDKYGNHVQWWSNKTIQTFENFTQCFIEQYDNFTIKGVAGHVKGKNTLGENLADNGGLNQAYAAYLSYVKKYGEEAKLPGFENFTNAQMFFIAYGSIWCETTTTEDLEEQIEYDEHCPNSIRVLGTLQNSDDFAKLLSVQ